LKQVSSGYKARLVQYLS